MLRFVFIYLCSILFLPAYSQEKKVIVTGRVTDLQTGAAVHNAGVKLSGSKFATLTDKDGNFSISLPDKPAYKLLFTHVSYESFFKELRVKERDSIFVEIKMKARVVTLPDVPVYAVNKPETLVGKPNYSVFDFDFYEDKLLLLTAERSLNNAEIRLADYNGKILSTYHLPKSAGEAKKFFHDYEGYTDIICADSIFRLDVMNSDLFIMTLPQHVFRKYIDPVSDTAFSKFYFDNNWEKYPAFSHFTMEQGDSMAQVLKSISNAQLLEMYNFELYFLPSRAQLEARRIADYYKTDVHIVAALMSGFTQSMYYDPLYAPLFILKDTVCIFNHHNDHLYHYDKNNKLIDSVNISYHHPKNWRHWKKQLFVDEPENKVYALFSKDSHRYLKEINFQTGQEVRTYKLKNHSADKIKIKDGYVYYVYRPFDSTQEKFLYREKIE